MTTKVQDFIDEYKKEVILTRRLLDRVPTEKFSWKPHEKSMSLGELSSHIVDNPRWMKILFESDSFAMEKSADPFQAKTSEELLEVFDRYTGEAQSQLDRVEENQLVRPWRMTSGDEVIYEDTRLNVLRFFMINHMVHHRGQLSVYLRLNDIPVPAIYGPSADEQ